MVVKNVYKAPMNIQTYDLYALNSTEYAVLYEVVIRFLEDNKDVWEVSYKDIDGWERYTAPRLSMRWNLTEKEKIKDIIDILTITRYQRYSHRLARDSGPQDFELEMTTTLYNKWMVWLVVNKKVRYINTAEDNTVWVSNTIRDK